MIPEDLRYTDQHEWVAPRNGGVRVGITHFAQDSLGDIVFVEVPDVGLEVVAGASCAEVESTKSVSEIYSPVSGTVSAVNETLADEPERINRDPYGDGWIFTLTMIDASELDALMDAAAYQHLVEQA